MPAAEAARTTARILLEIEAVHVPARGALHPDLGPRQPGLYRLPQDHRLPARPDQDHRARGRAIEREIGFESLDVVAGGETAGIPYAAWIADRLGLPMLYVRKKPKGFGRDAQIEGDMTPGAARLLVEDLATDGGSKVNFVNAIREAERQGRPCPGGVPLRHLPAERGDAGQARRAACMASPPGGTCWRPPRRPGLLSARRCQDVRAFLDDPEGWSASHGGKVVA